MKKLTLGFTLIEVTIIIGIIALLFTISSLNFSDTAPKNSLNNAIDNFVVNLKQQQLLAQTNSDSYGIYIGSSKYTQFIGDTYSAIDTSNYDTDVDEVSLSTSATGGVIIFDHGTGIVDNTPPEGITITFTQDIINKSKVVTINKYGIIESIL